MLSNQTAEVFTLSGNMILWPLSELIFYCHCYAAAAADLMQELQWNGLTTLNVLWCDCTYTALKVSLYNINRAALSTAYACRSTTMNDVHSEHFNRKIGKNYILCKFVCNGFYSLKYIWKELYLVNLCMLLNYACQPVS